MKNQNGISLISLIIIIIVVGIISIFFNSKSSITIQWDALPPTEYSKFRIVALESELYGNCTFPQESFNELGKDIKTAHGKWFRTSNTDFYISVMDEGNTEITTLSDGKNTAIFSFDTNSYCLDYTFKNEKHSGHKITIK